ncbi:DNRLRE domain-containing protein [Inquilinus sp. KBS0705]|nr:DNRLRE domain-containing protein [Inquilinus sp. KBS0705]
MTNKTLILALAVYILVYMPGCKKNEPADNQITGEVTHLAQKATFSESEAIEPTAISWSNAQGQPVATHEVHGEAVNNKLYIFGGFDVNKRPDTWTPTKRAYVYDPVTNKWSAIKSLPYTPNGDGFGGATHMGVTTDGSAIYFAGGYTSNSTGKGQVFGTNQVYKYDVSTDSYTKLPNLPQPLAAGQLRYLNGKLHYMGGANLSRQDVNVHYVLDVNQVAQGWQTAAPLLDAVNHPGSAVLNGKIYFIGGAHHQDNETETQKMLQVYTPETDSWQRLADMPVSVDHVSSSVITLGKRILVLGGETSHNVLSKAVQVYSPESNTWSQLTPLPSARSAGVAAVLNGTIYYTGGNFSTINRMGVPYIELLPTDDAFVRAGAFAALNYGLDSNLTVKGAANKDYDRKAYLKFDLTGVNNVVSAKLVLNGYNADNNTTIALSCYAVPDENWTEKTINFNTAPAAVTPSLSSAMVSNQPANIELDVTKYVSANIQSKKVMSFLVKDALGKNVTLQFKSKEGKLNRPRLVIKYN